MRWITGLAVLPLLMAQEEAPVFRANTRLVQFSVVALDKHGKAVTDLRQDELKLQEKGKARDIAFFRFEGGPEPQVAVKAKVPGLFTNRVEASPAPPRNITALVLDTLNTPPDQIMWVRAQLTRYLKELAPQTRVAVYHLGSRLQVLHDFTDDAASLRERLKASALPLSPLSYEDVDSTIRDAEQLLRIFPNDPMLQEMLQTQIETQQQVNANVRKRKLESTLASLDALGAHLSGIPGRKNMVWIGGGISMLSITGAMGFGPRGGIESFEERVVATARRLAQRGVAVYAVDSRGLVGLANMSASVAGTPDTVPGRGRFTRQQSAEQISSDPLPASFKLADITGGRAFRNTNDMTDGMQQALQDVQGAYVVAFYSQDEPDGKWHNVKMKVTRPGVKLLYREGFLAENSAAPPEAWTAVEWQAVIGNPLGSTAISLDARTAPVDEAPPGKIAVVLQLEPSQLQYVNKDGNYTAEIEIAIVEKDAQGRFRLMPWQGTVPAPGGDPSKVTVENSRFAHAWRPAADTKVIRLIVHDRRSHQYGTLDLPMEQVVGGKSK
jgi:VWFA-related protein